MSGKLVDIRLPRWNRSVFEQWLGKKSVQWSLRIIFAGAVTLLLSQLKLDPLEFVLYDLRAALTPNEAASGNVVLISIDDHTLTELSSLGPNAKQFKKTLEQMTNAAPAAIVSIVRPMEFPGTPPDLVELAEQATSSHLIYAENDLPQPGQKRLDPLPPPFGMVRTEPAPITRDHSLFIPRGVSRRVIIKFQNIWTLQARLAQVFNHFTNASQYRGVFHFSFDSEQTYVRFKTRFPRISFIDVMNGHFDPALLQGKLLLIGRESKSQRGTYLTVPTSRGQSDTSPLEVQASYIDSLITNSSPRLTPVWLTAILTFLLSILTMLVVMRLRPVRGLSVMFASMLFVVVLSFVGDLAMNWFFPVAPPLFGIIICYYFVLPYRLILENRRSWGYYQKNRMLTQVEELKSNFIRLMSHDLKTPIARIQAMAEIVLRERQRLSEQQVEALENITYSSEELSRFIGSILNLSRIQSKKVKLQLKTRDITQLLVRVIRNCQDLAGRKNIQIVTEFEPLFPLKMDEDLMKQVFTNLVENAIKYSPESTQVKVAAKEIGGRVVVQIADQGIGIPQGELPHVFEQFYRAQNAEYENNGTGLGLYLAKYFVNLHNGTIDVTSQAAVGSTFSVRLPLDDDKGVAHV